jgi:hypothetical protein
VVDSFKGVPSAYGFTKRYELHYQPKKMIVDGAKVLVQYGASTSMLNVTKVMR